MVRALHLDPAVASSTTSLALSRTTLGKSLTHTCVSVWLTAFSRPVFGPSFSPPPLSSSSIIWYRSPCGWEGNRKSDMDDEVCCAIHVGRSD